jgi:metal-responsive CopG/Arc/MetJ family transcriptional regulator
MKRKTKKATFNLPADILDELDKMMSERIVPSKNALVEQALIKELKELKRQNRRTQWGEATKSPLFMKDIDQVEADFHHADTESARRIS